MKVEFILATVFRLILALVLGSIIGIDRTKKGSPAGIKTHSLVCIGAALIILLSEYLHIMYKIDISRMPAQVISGIGFLGAGTIIVTGKNRIKGITSAASIWFSGCVGLALGAGFYEGAIVAVLLELVVFKILSKANFGKSKHFIYEVYIEYNPKFKVSSLIKTLKKYDSDVVVIEKSNFSVFDSSTKKNVVVTLTSRNLSIQELMEKIILIDGIIDVDELN